MKPGSGPSQAAARSAPAGSVASHAGSRSEPLSAGGGVRSEVEEVGDESDGGDVLDDLILDPVTLEVRCCAHVAEQASVHPRRLLSPVS